MAEVLEPDPGAAEGSEAPAVETPGWEVPEDAGPQVGAARRRGGCGLLGGERGVVPDLICNETGGCHRFN